jgi:hypothetical protein
MVSPRVALAASATLLSPVLLLFSRAARGEAEQRIIAEE